MIKEGANMTKTKFYLENKRSPQAGKRAVYVDQYNRMEASLMLRVRCRMLNFKHNFWNMHQDTKCRLYGKDEETQEHALEMCKGIEPFNIGKGTTRDIFEEDRKKLLTTAIKIENITEKFQVGLPPGASGPADPGIHTNWTEQVDIVVLMFRGQLLHHLFFLIKFQIFFTLALM